MDGDCLHVNSESLGSLLIAAAAFAVSLVTLYAQFFRRRERAIAILIDKAYERHPRWFQYAVVNTGDVTVLLRMMLCDSLTMTFATTSSQLPSLIRPGEVKLIRIELTPGDKEPAGVHFFGVSAKGRVFKAGHKILGCGLTLPMQGGPYWELFRIL